MKDEKILAKIGKLLSKYGVTDEEKENFIGDLREMKDDDEEENPSGEQPPETETTSEEANAPAEQGGEEETPVEEGQGGEEKTTPTEEPQQEEEKTAEESPANEEEGEPKPVDRTEEFQKTIEGLQARIEQLEGIVQKLGVPTEEQPVGAEPTNPSGEAYAESTYDSFNRKRLGR